MPAAPRNRHEVGRLLDRDEAYDEDPYGDPPISVARYRASARAVLAAAPAEPGRLAEAWSQREREAYRAGGRATIHAIIQAMGAVLSAPARPAHPPPPASAPLRAVPAPPVPEPPITAREVPARPGGGAIPPERPG